MNNYWKTTESCTGRTYQLKLWWYIKWSLTVQFPSIQSGMAKYLHLILMIWLIRKFKMKGEISILFKCSTSRQKFWHSIQKLLKYSLRVNTLPAASSLLRFEAHRIGTWQSYLLIYWWFGFDQKQKKNISLVFVINLLQYMSEIHSIIK